MARPTKLTPEIMPKLEKLYRRGFTDEEVAEILDITQQTINNWKKKDPLFFESIKDWKKNADKKVERALFERATGYKHPEDKIFNDNGVPLVVPTEKHYPPDTQAASLWLRNRMPNEWRDKVEIGAEISGNPDKPIKWEFEVVETKNKNS